MKIQLPTVYKLEDNQDNYKRQLFKFGMRTIILTDKTTKQNCKTTDRVRDC